MRSLSLEAQTNSLLLRLVDPHLTVILLIMLQVQTGSFVLRVVSFSKYEQLLPKSLAAKLEDKAPSFWKWANAVANEESVTYIWDEKLMVDRTLARLAKAAAK